MTREAPTPPAGTRVTVSGLGTFEKRRVIGAGGTLWYPEHSDTPALFSMRKVLDALAADRAELARLWRDARTGEVDAWRRDYAEIRAERDAERARREAAEAQVAALEQAADAAQAAETQAWSAAQAAGRRAEVAEAHARVMDSLLGPMPNRAPDGLWPPRCVQRAFVAGAKWWEHHKEGATMWQSDQRLAEDEAARRYGDPTAEPPHAAP